MATEWKNRSPRVERVVEIPEIHGPRFEDNPAGRVLQSVAKQDPRIVGLLHSLGADLVIGHRSAIR